MNAIVYFVEHYTKCSIREKLLNKISNDLEKVLI